jgi:hypothetical protein
MEKPLPKESASVTWGVVFLCVVVILIQGFFTFFIVGDRGQPDWDYRQVKDVPGQSPQAIYEKLPYGQHVRGGKGE